MTSLDRNLRVALALRQGAVLAGCLIVGGAAVDRLRPDEAAARDIVTTPFLWGAVLSVAVLLLHAVAFEESQMRRLEREPLVLGGVAAAVTLLVGLVSFDAGSTGSRIVYLVANAVGALVFWWAIFSLAWLLFLIARGD